jgi:dolichol-phosphate mannosyltransferase
MNDAADLSVVLPAYLEEENLRRLLPRLTRTLEELGIRWEVLVVDTVTPMDNTAEVCGQHRCRWLPREGGNNFADAVRTGIARAAGRRILFMDADGSHPPEFVADLWSHRDDAEIVIASRYTAGGFTENGRLLVWMSRVLNLSYSWFLGIPCHDVSNSFKLYPGDELRRLNLECSHFDVVEEILYKLMRGNHRLRIAEIPFTFKKRMCGDTKRNLVLFMLSYLFTMVRLRCMKTLPRALPPEPHSPVAAGPARHALISGSARLPATRVLYGESCSQE